MLYEVITPAGRRAVRRTLGTVFRKGARIFHYTARSSVLYRQLYWKRKRQIPFLFKKLRDVSWNTEFPRCSESEEFSFMYFETRWKIYTKHNDQIFVVITGFLAADASWHCTNKDYNGLHKTLLVLIGSPMDNKVLSGNLMTLSEIANYLKVAEKTVLRMIQKDEIPCVKIASQWRS